MDYQPRSVLVTGGAGFIGSNFVGYLLEHDPTVCIVNLDKLTYAGSQQNLQGLTDPARHQFIMGDICDAQLVERILEEHAIDTVVHFAAESHVDRSISGPAPFIQTNVVGTFTLLETCRRSWSKGTGIDPSRYRFHHISTDEVYGTLEADDPPFSERTPYAPNSPYSASKAGSDHLARAYFHTYGVPVTTTNCSNNYGPRQHSEKFIPTIIRACLTAAEVPVYGDGSNIRDWLYVDDHCCGIHRVLRGGRLGETYNIGGGNEQANNDIAAIVCRLMDELHPSGAPHERLIKFVVDRPGHDWRYAIDGTRMAQELDWHPEVRFEEGLRKTCLWYLQSRAGESPADET